MSTYKANIWKIYLFQFFTSLHFLGGVLIPFFVDWGGLSFAQILFLQSWFLFCVFILEIPTGTVADYLGRKHSLILGALFTIIGAVTYTLYANFYLFMLAEFLWAVASALISGADEALLYDTLKKIKKEKESKKFFARLESVKMVGLMVAAPLGSLMGVYMSLRAPMFLMAIPFLFAAIIGFTFKEPKTTKKIESKRYLIILKEGVKYFYKHKALKILALDVMVIASIAYLMIWLYQQILRDVGVGTVYFGLVHVFLVIGQLLVMNNYDFFEKLFGSKKRFIFASALITGISVIVAGLTKFLPVVLLAMICALAFGLGRRPLFASYLNKHIPTSKRATVLSSVSMFRRMFLIILNPIVGFAVDWSLSYTLIILGSIAVIFSFISQVKEEHLLD
jgi:MFS family permease